MKHQPATLALATLLAAFSGVAANSALAQSVVVLPNLTGSEISADGLTVSGSLRGSNPNAEAVFWRPGSGYVHTGLASLTDIAPIYLSGNGQYISQNSLSDGRAYRRSISGVTDFLSSLTPSIGFAPRGISYDGNVIVGFSQIDSPSTVIVSWRWTPQTGLQSLPFQAAFAVSGDGNTITGTTLGSQDGVLRNGVFSLLPNLSTGGASFRASNAINYDGSVIVGVIGGSPARWTDNGSGFQAALVPVPPGATSGSATYVTGDGSLILGVAEDLFLWSQATGSVNLRDYFLPYGIDLSPYSLTRATVSNDGHTFAIDAITIATQRYTTLIVNIPAPTSAAVLGLGGLLACRRRR